jgi:hypothetical protein
LVSPQVMMIAFARKWLPFVVLGLGLTGCKERHPQTFPVTITITYPDKKPVVGAQVAARSDERKTIARGVTGNDGSCKLTTFKQDDGVVVGRNLVSVAKPPLIGDPDKPYSGPRIANKFSNFTTSGLVVTVTEDASKNSFPLTITAH